METVADLVRQTRAGDSDAFARLVRRYLRAARAVALAEVEEPADAEDACQEAFVVALERIDDCRHPERFGGWLMVIVRNRARNLRRAERTRAALPLETLTDVPGSGGPVAERIELRARLQGALRSLSPLQREIVLLHDLEGFPHAEIAEALGISTGASRVQLHRARGALRRILEER